MAGVPVGQLSSGTQDLLRNLDEHLAGYVVGQDHAVEILARAVRLAFTGLRDPRRPKGVFMFVGPSGVGKTQLAKSLAILLFGDEKALVRLDMSEYSEKYTVSRLIGAPPGYVGHDEPGQLTQPLRNRPHCIVLLDEIEKAHPEIFDICLQLFDEGRLTDAQGRPVDGRHALFIMTSNLGAAHSHSRALGFREASDTWNEHVVMEAIAAFFRPEFLNRIDHIVSFRQLDYDDLVEIAHIELQHLKQRMNENNIRLTYERDVADVIADEALKHNAGARGIKRAVEELIAVPVSDMLISATVGKHDWLHIETRHNELILGWV
jgi:ATP-dependent Clp protease ATP-binding subunit ClpC